MTAAPRQTGLGERVTGLIRRYHDGVRRRLPRWKGAWTARPIIHDLQRLKSLNERRPFCGIFLLEHIGDIIACEPVIGQLRRSHPDAFIVWVVKPEYRILLASHPEVDAVVCANSLFEIAAIVKSNVFDQNVDLHVNLKATNIDDVGYEKRWGDPSIDADNYFRHGSLLAALSKGAGLQASREPPTIYVPEHTILAVRNLELPDHFVVVHATSNVDVKDWTRAKWHDLVEHILEHYDTHVIEVGLTRSIDLDHHRFMSFCGRLSILETAEVIRNAAFFLGIDSAPAHMANAWGTPGLLLFGRMNGFDAFNPYEGYYAMAAESVILRYPGPLRDLTVEEAIRALEASELWKAARRSSASATDPVVG